MTGGKGGWLPLPGGGVSDLDDLTDVDLTTDTPSDGDALTFDSASSLWVPAAPSLGGGGDLVQLDQVTLGTAAADVTFSSIPATYQDLFVVAEARLSNGGNNHDLHMQVGATTPDTGSNYFWTQSYIEATVARTQQGPVTSARVGQPQAAGRTAGFFSIVEVTIGSYATTGRGRWGMATSRDYDRHGQSWFNWTNTAAAIGTLKFFNPSGGNLVAASRFTLYGRGTA